MKWLALMKRKMLHCNFWQRLTFDHYCFLRQCRTQLVLLHKNKLVNFSNLSLHFQNLLHIVWVFLQVPCVVSLPLLYVASLSSTSSWQLTSAVGCIHSSHMQKCDVWKRLNESKNRQSANSNHWNSDETWAHLALHCGSTALIKHTE